ncbi:MAG: NrpR regulatory domain-containing protein [Candidatus Margulisbacteria bacterium]|nr:NrpR regulatory domain-containing protein [Candidatus Margulisiibacteriota bacterium]
MKLVAEAKEPIGSAEIAEKLKVQGFDMPERTIRYHLKELSEKGLMKGLWKEGRVITSKGIEELSNAMVFDKVGFMNSRIDNLSYQMDYDLEKKSGRVILNLSLLKKEDFRQALKIMAPVFVKKLTIGDKVLLVEAGNDLGGVTIPEGWVGFGTLCSINLNGVLLKHGIAMEPRMGGLLQIESERPVRFTAIINYDGTTLDPHEVFIKSRMTSVGAATSGAGKVLAGLREVPAATVHETEAIIRKIESAGFGRVLLIGKPGQTVLGIPIGGERVGIVVPGGLNPIAAVEEAGIETASKALSALVDADQLVDFSDL